jgi:hypothetical protein
MSDSRTLPSTEDLQRQHLEAMPTYQRYDAIAHVRFAARLLKRDGEIVIYRDAFRWKDDATDSVLPNHYECQSLDYLAEEHGYVIVHDFHHVGVVRRKSNV